MDCFCFGYSPQFAFTPSFDSTEFREAIISDSRNQYHDHDFFSEPSGELHTFCKPYSGGGCSGRRQFNDALISQLSVHANLSEPVDGSNFSEIKDASPIRALNNALLSNCNVPIFNASSKIPNPDGNLDTDESLDERDHVDSPCWNGAQATGSSIFDGDEALHSELIDKIEECLASYLEGPRDFHVEIAKYGKESSEISNKNKMQNGMANQEKGLTGLARKISASQERNSDGVGNDGRSDVAKEETKYMSQNQNPSNGLSSPSFIAASPEKASAEVPAPRVDIQMLVKMLHNMSELLIGHCLNDEFRLNERDRSILENTISNIRTCTLNNPEEIVPAQKRTLPKLESGDLAGESPQLQQNSHVKEPHISKAGAAQHANVEQGKECGTISDSPRITSDDTEMEKADNMKKAMKRILIENFREEEEAASHALLYKDLWLEAEAELCSLVYRARFNRMIQVEKCSSNNGDDGLVKGGQSKTEAKLKLNQDQNHEGEGSENVDRRMKESNKEASLLARFHALITSTSNPEESSNSVESGAPDMPLPPILAFEDGSDASCLRDSSDEEHDQEIRPGSCHSYGNNELVTDDDDDDWELV